MRRDGVVLQLERNARVADVFYAEGYAVARLRTNGQRQIVIYVRRNVGVLIDLWRDRGVIAAAADVACVDAQGEHAVRVFRDQGKSDTRIVPLAGVVDCWLSLRGDDRLLGRITPTEARPEQIAADRPPVVRPEVDAAGMLAGEVLVLGLDAGHVSLRVARNELAIEWVGRARGVEAIVENIEIGQLRDDVVDGDIPVVDRHVETRYESRL